MPTIIAAAPVVISHPLSVFDAADGLLVIALLLFAVLNVGAIMALRRTLHRRLSPLKADRHSASALSLSPQLTLGTSPDVDDFYRRASQASGDALWEWRVGAVGVIWGSVIGDRWGYPAARSGTTVDWFLHKVHASDRRRIITSLREAMAADGQTWREELRFRMADGDYATVAAKAHIERAADGAPLRLTGALTDITETKRAEEALRWRADHDPVTGLPNRNAFGIHLEAALTAGKERVGLILFGIDNFKGIRDAWGPTAADALARSFAEQLTAVAPVGAIIARVGDDEFAMILASLAPSEPKIDAVSSVAARLVPTFAFEGAAIDCMASIGAAFWPADGETSREVLRSADLALYSARAAGRGLVRIYEPEMRVSIERRASMITVAREAITDDRIVPFYQVKVDLKTCAIVGFEALLRWHDHRHGLQPPKTIDAAFEDMELAARLTDRMIDRTIHDVRGWLHRGIDFRRIAINGSAPDFVRGDFAERLLDRLHKAGIPPTRFELEVTESVFIGQIADNVERILTTLNEAGTTIALDDFGTGYASLAHIKQFPVDALKIDQSFISSREAGDLDDLAIVRAVIGLGQSLGICTVAEGVETLAQANLLRREGCDAGQGYLFGRAVDASRVPNVVATLPVQWRINEWGQIQNNDGPATDFGEQVPAGG